MIHLMTTNRFYGFTISFLFMFALFFSPAFLQAKIGDRMRARIAARNQQCQAESVRKCKTCNVTTTATSSVGVCATCPNVPQPAVSVAESTPAEEKFTIRVTSDGKISVIGCNGKRCRSIPVTLSPDMTYEDHFVLTPVNKSVVVEKPAESKASTSTADEPQLPE